MQNEIIALIEKYSAEQKYNSNIFEVVGYVKLVLLAVFAICGYIMFAQNFEANSLLMCGICLVPLAIIWAYHDMLYKKVAHLKGVIAVYNRHLDRRSGKWTEFSDMGAEFIDREHPYTSDLDVVGKKSLFQFLNNTNTWHGRRAFAHDLMQAEYSATQIQARQAAVAELASDAEFGACATHQLSKIGADTPVQKLIAELSDGVPYIKNRVAKAILTIMPICTFVFVAAILLFKLENLYFAGLVCVTAQAVIWMLGVPKTQAYMGTTAKLPHKLAAYASAIKVIKAREFTSKKLNSIRAELSSGGFSAEQAMGELGKISDKLSVKNNLIVYFLLNVFCFWDYFCAFQLEKWKKKYALAAEGWFLALGEFESLLSLANLAYASDSICMPTLTSERNVVRATKLGHILLPNTVRVNNDVSSENGVFIISGSNMSGKTTFLRTVGLNLVLAHCGGFVCAEKMTCSQMKIMTSMRIADDLNEGVSTFYAELMRIKNIIELAKKEPKMMFLIDEIFRGTNSVDRLSGAKTVMEKLCELGATGMITTHDLELCELEKQNIRVKNYHFSESYEDKKILFDYEIRDGKSTTTNAKYLMEILGII